MYYLEFLNYVHFVREMASKSIIFSAKSPLKVWWLALWPAPPSCSTPTSSSHWPKLVQSSSAQRCCSSWFPLGRRGWSVRPGSRDGTHIIGKVGKPWSAYAEGYCFSTPAEVWGRRTLAGHRGLQEQIICSMDSLHPFLQPPRQLGDEVKKEAISSFVYTRTEAYIYFLRRSLHCSPECQGVN